MTATATARYHDIAEWPDWQLRDRLPTDVADYILSMRGRLETAEDAAGENENKATELDEIYALVKPFDLYDADDIKTAAETAHRLAPLEHLQSETETRLRAVAAGLVTRWRNDRRRLKAVLAIAAGKAGAVTLAELMADRDKLAELRAGLESRRVDLDCAAICLGGARRELDKHESLSGRRLKSALAYVVNSQSHLAKAAGGAS